MRPAQSVLIFSEYVPMRTLSGSRTRFAAVAEYFQARGYEIHLVVVQQQPARVELPPDARRLVQRLSRLSLADHREFNPHFPTIHLLSQTRAVSGWLTRLWHNWTQPREFHWSLPRQVDRLLQRERPHIAFVDHSWLAPLVREAMAKHDCLWLVDTHDCLTLRDQTLQAAGLPMESGLTRAEEGALLEPFDVVIAIQEQERRVFQEMLPGKRVIAVPHCQPVAPQTAQRPTIGFVGSNCDQNVCGLDAFLRHAWPEIARRCPEATVEIVGNVCQAQPLRQAARGDGRIRLLGVVPEVADIYRGPAVMICPLWVGSGLKIKLVEALAFGKASVVTPLAAMGCEAGIDRAFLLAREPRDFVAPVVEILGDAARRRALERAALEFADTHFSPGRAWAELDAVLAELSTRRAPHALPTSPPAAAVPAAPTAPLLARSSVVQAQSTRIPKIIHQTWKQANVPFEYLGMVDSWRKLHPEWEYRLWTDADNRRFIAESYPEFLSYFDAYPKPIQRADAVRYFLLHHFGGLYADLDCRACRPLDPLLADKTCVLALEPSAHARTHHRECIVGNAIMASMPRHPFLQTVIRRLPEFHDRPTLSSTGPFMVSEVLAAFEQPETVSVVPAAQLSPLTMEQADLLRTTGYCDADLSAAYAIHFHQGTWWRAPGAGADKAA